jgi:ABC-type transport system substrate-binding protein
VSNDGTVLPGVAQEWKRSGRQTIFKLKANATFNDGTPITVVAVRDSLCRSMQPGALFSWSLLSIQHTRSSDGKTVSCDGISANEGTNEVTLTEGTAKQWLFEALAGPGGWITKPGAASSQYGNVPGAGPYSLREVVPDNRVVLQARSGGPIAPAAREVLFTLIGDDSQAATAFRTGALDALEVTNPNLAKLLDLDKQGTDGSFAVTSVASDRMRLIIVNRRGLEQKGFNVKQTSALMNALNKGFSRQDFVDARLGLAAEATTPFPFPLSVPAAAEAGSFPNASLTAITEGDAYSDLIASRIPKTVGDTVRIDYKGIDKGLLIDRIVKGDFELASVAVEGTLRAPEFWLSFFQPGSPFTVFGEPIAELKGKTFDTEEDRAFGLRTVAEKGNWVGLLRERNVVVTRKEIVGLTFTPAGQVTFESIGRR